MVEVQVRIAGQMGRAVEVCRSSPIANAVARAVGLEMNE